ncbi:MAG: alpha/beta hydrolase-fold protein [Spirosomataceae bacterium]
MSSFFTTEHSEPNANSAGLRFMTVKSNALRKRTDLTYYVPQVSDKESLIDVPIVILLHGVYGSHWAWALKGKAHQTIQQLIDSQRIKPMVLVMPSDGLFGDGSGYLPHQNENYERWIVEDVIQAMLEQVYEVNAQSPVFLAGLSMGGFGALRLGAKYPQRFRAFSGLSSITHFEQLSQFVEDFNTLKNSTLEHDGVLDWILQNKDQLPPFRFDCGQEDNLLEANRALHHELNTHQIAHEYEEFAGGHSWDYWQTHLTDTLLFFNQWC